jgi:hypothetical protein
VLQLLAPHLAARRRELRLRQLVSSGELLPADLAGVLLDAVPPGCRVLNLYGRPWGFGLALWAVLDQHGPADPFMQVGEVAT